MYKLVLISYNEAIDEEVGELLKNCGLENYTKIPGVFGKGTTSGIHLGNDIWPGRNNLLYVVCQDDAAKKLLSGVRTLRQRLGREGIKAFLSPVEEVT